MAVITDKTQRNNLFLYMYSVPKFLHTRRYQLDSNPIKFSVFSETRNSQQVVFLIKRKNTQLNYYLPCLHYSFQSKQAMVSKIFISWWQMLKIWLFLNLMVIYECATKEGATWKFLRYKEVVMTCLSLPIINFYFRGLRFKCSSYWFK